MLYDSNETPPIFQGYFQQRPLYYCRRERFNLELSLAKCWGNGIKCRNPRCSYPCAYNYAVKKSACLAKHLEAIKDTGMFIYRGHLRMNIRSLPDEHRKAKARFLRLINDLKNRHGYVLKVYAHQDITDSQNMHWDVVIYSDAPKTTVGRVISQAWSSAGGLRNTTVKMDDDEITSQARYATKDTTEKQRHLHLPVNWGEDGYMEMSWQTSGFWQGKSVDAIWRGIIDAWLQEEKDRLETLAERRPIVGNKLTTINILGYDPDPWENHEVFLAWVALSASVALWPLERRLEALNTGEIRRDEKRQRSDARGIKLQLPRTFEDAVKMEKLSGQCGMSEVYIYKILKKWEPKVCSTGGWENGKGSAYGSYWWPTGMTVDSTD
jgi:hypothetical protein